MSYGFYRTVGVDHTKCGSADTAGFSVLVKGTYSWAATVANGGKVNNTTTVTVGGRTYTVPADLVFASDATGSSLLTWEFESYDATTGAFIAWVLVPTLSVSVNTTFYVAYGDTTITTFQGGGRGAAWSASELAVYHTPDGTTLYPYDSTANAYDLTNTNGATAVAGKIGGAASFTSASSQYLTRASSPVTAAPLTLSAWTDLESVSSSEFPIVALDDVSGNSSYWLDSFLLAGQQYWRLIQRYSGGAYQQWYTVTPDGSEHYVVGTFTNSSTMAFYLDGALQSPSVTVGSPGSPATMAVTNIGGSTVAGYGTGYVEEARIRSGIITTSAITAEYNNQNSPSTFYTIGNEVQIVSPIYRGIALLNADPVAAQNGAAWYNTIEGLFKYQVSALPGTASLVLYANSQQDNVVANASPQGFVLYNNLTFPANFLNLVGRYFKLRLGLTTTVASGGNQYTFNIQLGSTVIGQWTTPSLSNGNQAAVLDVDIITNATGATGVIYLNGGVVGTSAFGAELFDTNATTVDLTASQTLVFSFTGTTEAADSMTLNYLAVTLLV